MKVIWDSYDAVLPGLGHATFGEVIELPEDVAKQFISTGQAKTMSEPKNKRSKIEGEIL